MPGDHLGEGNIFPSVLRPAFDDRKRGQSRAFRLDDFLTWAVPYDLGLCVLQPGELREQTKAFLASSLKAVITQVLIKTPDGRGRRAIFEILVNTRAIAKLITTDQTHQIPSQLQTGKALGMQLMDQALLDAIAANEIDPDDAYLHAGDKKKFQRFVTDTALVSTMDGSNSPQEADE